MAPHDSSPGRTYRYYIGTPIFSFGHGLSYTTFEIKFDNQFKHLKDWVFTIAVTNKGPREGDDVIMTYFTPLSIPESEPAHKIRY